MRKVFAIQWKVILAGIALALLLLASSSSLAQADDYDCTGALGAITVDSLNVPQNATCTLNGTQVKGNLVVRSSATLYAYDVTLDGNLQADHSARVEVHPGSFVRNNIRVESSGPAVFTSVRISGNLQVLNSWGNQSYAHNVVDGNLQIFDNLGGVSIQDNSINGNLQCKGNNPAPTGEGNNVAGNMEGQCANLQESSPTPVPTNTPTVTASFTPVPTKTPAITTTPTLGAPEARLIANEDLYTLTEQQISVPAPGILENDQITGKDPVEVLLVTPPQHGTVSLGQQGDFVYQAQSGYFGEDSFEYLLRISRIESDPARVQLLIPDIEAPTVHWIAPVLEGERYDLREGEQVLLEVEASDNDTIRGVNFLLWDYVNQTYITLDSLALSPYRIEVSAGTLNPNWNQVFVVASDPAGNNSKYASIWLYKVIPVKMTNRIYLPVVGN